MSKNKNSQQVEDKIRIQIAICPSVEGSLLQISSLLKENCKK